jgi:uncharacterized membrane protein
MPSSVMVALLAVAVVAAAFLVSVASFAYGRLGLDLRWAFLVVFGSILGSRFNVPVVRLRGVEAFCPMLIRVYGMLYVIPRPVRIGTKVIAVNVGGAMIPTVLSMYLIVRNDLGWRAVVAITVVSFVTHVFARIVPGVGIVVPTLVPPITAALTAWVIGTVPIAALAYVGGTLGTLIGGDLLNLRRVRRIDAPVLSIGGAGTFDGVFVTGVLAVLLAAG